MKNFTFITIAITLFLLSSCSVNKIINYDDTNPMKIEQATKGLKISELLPSPSNLDGTIAVRSIEIDIDNRLDLGVLYMIEDHLLSSLINNQYRVVERDPDALNNYHRESTAKYRKENPDYVGSNASTNTEKYLETNLSSADYILSYRVIECGVVYNEIENVKDAIDKVERSARTRLHCRLSNAKTSELLAAGLVENEVTDIVERSDLKSLNQISYNYYHHTLPLQQSQNTNKSSSNVDDKNKEIIVETSNNNDNSEKEKPKKSKKKNRWWVHLVFPLFALLTDSD